MSNQEQAEQERIRKGYNRMRALAIAKGMKRSPNFPFRTKMENGKSWPVWARP